MSRTLLRSLICLGVCAVVASPALAQGRGGRGGFGGFGGPNLVAGEQVQKELKVTAEQKEKIDAILKEARDARPQGGRQNFREMSEADRTKLFEEGQKRNAETQKKLEGALNADQVKRLKEINLQVRGTSGALNDPEVAKELKLTDEQVTALKTISDETNKKRRELFGNGGGGGGGQGNREKMEQLNKDANDESLAVLKDDQKTQFEKMKGEKFELDRSQFQRRGGANRRSRGTNNNS